MEKLFRYVPQWIAAGLRGRTCTKCNAKIAKKDIIAVGVRQTNERYVIYVEHACPRCKWREMTNFNRKKATIEELCYLLLDGVKSRKATEKAQQMESATIDRRSKISDEEVASFLDFLNSNTSYEEFMKYIRADQFKGIIDEQYKDES